MRARHRIPSIFNLYMVDVLCCALGCVILVWLVNLRDAKRYQATAAAKDREMTTLLAAARGDRDAAYTAIAELKSQLERTQADRDLLRRQLAQQQALTADLETKYRSATAAAAALEDDVRAGKKRDQEHLARMADLDAKLRAAAAAAAALEDDVRVGKKRDEGRLARISDLESSLRNATGRVTALEGKVRLADRRYDEETTRAMALLRKLEAANVRLKDLEAAAALVPGLKDDLKASQLKAQEEEALARALEREVARRRNEMGAASKKAEDLERELEQARRKGTTTQERIKALEDLLAQAGRSTAALEAEKSALQAEVGRVRAAAENRFAGIALTGRRVVFLVDMSGSMDLVAKKEAAPTKWAEVRQTVARIMRSLPELEKFQVILFAEGVRYPLGGEGAWIDYDARTSAEATLKALAAVRPEGGTNMYSALGEAFRLRPQGLDTIYLLSDGLPNEGEGLPENPPQALTESEKNDLLSRQIRRVLKTSWNAPRLGQPKVRINSVGFFFESPEVGAFLWALSRENDGSFVGMSRP